jgi:(p)ppGpp synthase/HD superfamily hydrolase
MLSKAIRLATELYDGKTRADTGLPSIIYHMAVVSNVAVHCNDETAIVAALLYNLIEDSHINLDSIEDQFGQNVSKLVKEVVSINESKELSQIVKKMVESSDSAITIKLCELFQDIYEHHKKYIHTTEESEDVLNAESVTRLNNIAELRTELKNNKRLKRVNSIILTKMHTELQAFL